MDFQLTEEQKRVLGDFRTFCEQQIAPLAQQVDVERMVPRSHFSKLARAGYLGFPIPKTHGGRGMGVLMAVMATEELSRVCPSTALAAGTSLMGFGLPLLAYGTQNQRERYLPKIVKGDWIGAWALTEETGSDTRSITTFASRTGDGFSLDGHKIYVINGPVADVFMVMALLEGKGSEDERIRPFLVHRTSDGLLVGPPHEKMGARGAQICDFYLQGCNLPPDGLLGGKRGPSLRHLEALPYLRLMAAGYCLGIGQASVERAIGHALKREVGGRPIATYQEVSFRIAEMHVQLDAARHLTYKAAWAVDKGLEASMDASIARLFASEMACQCAHHALQIHGGAGLMEGHPMERLSRDCHIGEVLAGTSEMHRSYIIEILLQ